MARWKDWRRRTETLEREASEGIQENREPRYNQQHSDEAKRGGSQKRWSKMPSANPPGNVTCNNSWGNHEEYCRGKNGEYSPHGREFYMPVAGWSANRKLGRGTGSESGNTSTPA